MIMKSKLGRRYEEFSLKQVIFEGVCWTFEHISLKFEGNSPFHREVLKWQHTTGNLQDIGQNFNLGSGHISQRENIK